MSRILYILLIFSLFVYYLFKIIKKNKNPVLNGAAAAAFGLFTLREIIPLISKFIGKFL